MVFGLGQLPGASLFAQSAGHAPSVVLSNAIPAPPMPPSPKSPVALFRDLLAMSIAERKDVLTNRSPESRELILAKVREYESLKPDERELRLQVTELRWYLLPLMKAPGTNRAVQLTMIPPEVRKQVEARLQQWDNLPADLQKEFLNNQAAVQYFTDQAVSPPEQRSQSSLTNMPPTRRTELEAGIKRFQEMTPEQRQKIVNRFDQFFSLTLEEKEKALKTLSEAERRQIEKTLKAFENLPQNRRAACLRSFEKFASLSLEERQQFLKNAEQWKQMTPNERQAWRNLVKKLALRPPLPPGLALPPPPPPLPGPRRAPPTVATNSN